MTFALAPHHRKTVSGGELITDGLVDLWDYSEKSGTIVAGLNGNDIILSNTAPEDWKTEADPRYQDSFEFNGVNAFGRATSVVHGVGLGDFSFVTFALPFAATLADTYKCVQANGAYAPGMYVSVTGGEWGCFWSGAGAFLSGEQLVADTWVHLAMVRESGTLKFYRDAVQSPETHNVASRNVADHNHGVGYNGSQATSSSYCRLAMTRFYARALSQSEISLIQQGNG